MFSTHTIANIIQVVLAFVFVLSVHESAHAGVAYLLGDDTAKRMGRLTLNPLVHIDLIGLLFLIVFRFGWAKPVIFDHRNFKRPKLYAVLTALAGPVANILLALLVLFCWKITPLKHLPTGIAGTLNNIFPLVAQISVMLGVFNLLPIPPLDGGHFLMVALIDRYPKVLLWIYQYSFFILLGAFYFVPGFSAFLLTAIETVYTFLWNIVF